MVLPFIQLAGHRIEYSVSKGKSTRTTYFRFRPDMRLEIVVPRGRTIDVHAAIIDRRDWIVKHFEQLRESPRILDGTSLMYDGRRLSIVFEGTKEQEELLPDLSTGIILIRAGERSRIIELVRRWFFRETSRYVIRRLSEISASFDINYSRADVRQMRNWGYCTRDARLSFNWQLIALPVLLREYIIMHELAHLKVFNHSPAFKKYLGELCPDYRERERALNRITPGNLSEYLG